MIPISDGRVEAFVAIFINRLQALAVFPPGRTRGRRKYSTVPRWPTVDETCALSGGWGVGGGESSSDPHPYVYGFAAALQRQAYHQGGGLYLGKAYTGIGLLPVPVIALHAAAGTMYQILDDGEMLSTYMHSTGNSYGCRCYTR